MRVIGNHELTLCHKEAVEKMLILPKTTRDVGELLSSQLTMERKQNREILLLILKSIKFLARQGLALRGASKECGEVDGNFMHILSLFSDSKPELLRWMERRRDKYISAEIQNELLKIVALRVLRTIAANIGERRFTIMADETTDCSTIEQCVIVIRWVDEHLEPHEDFIGFYSIPTANSDTLVAVIKDALLRMNLSLANCRGQCCPNC